MKESCRNESIPLQSRYSHFRFGSSMDSSETSDKSYFLRVAITPFVVSSDSLALGINISWKEMPDDFHFMPLSIRSE